MKKTSSVHLEEDMWNEILDYQNTHNLSSKNVALERMLLERRILIQLINNQSFNSNTIPTLQKNSNSNSQPLETEVTESDQLKDSIMNTFSSMPE